MRLRLLVVVAVVGALGGDAAYAQRQLEFYVSAVDAAGTPVTDLDADEFLVTEDGDEASIDRVELVTRPVKVQVLVDNGIGTAGQLVQFRNGLKGFFEALPLGVEASLITFAPQPRFVVRPTNDRLQITKGVDLIAPDEGGSKFMDALVEAAGRIESENKGRNQ